MSKEDIEKLECFCDEKADTWIWILSVLILDLINNIENEKTTVNIYLGDD